jgi:hypothetical protein
MDAMCSSKMTQALSELHSITNQKSILFIPSQFCPTHVTKDLKFSPTIPSAVADCNK